MAAAILWSALGAWLVCGLVGTGIALWTYIRDPTSRWAEGTSGGRLAMGLVVAVTLPVFGVIALIGGLNYRHEVRSRLF